MFPPLASCRRSAPPQPHASWPASSASYSWAHTIPCPPPLRPCTYSPSTRRLETSPRPWVLALLSGLSDSFRIGLQQHPQCRSRHSNSPSARAHPEVVRDFLHNQVRSSYMVGPLDPTLCGNIVTSSIAVIPKKNPGKWRVIVDLSSPQGASTNDSLKRRLTHVAYSSVADAATLMHALGPGTLLAKIDIRDAYRIVPVHPQDRLFLGVSWDGSVYVDCQLPFGLASAPAIFSAVAEALDWVLRSRGIWAIVHYLDNFLLLGTPGSAECQEALQLTLATCAELGIPIAPDKVEGPSPVISFLGIELNSAEMRLALPATKLSTLRSLLCEISGAKSVSNRQAFESLVGHLVHASQVIPLGRAFLNRLFPVLRALHQGAHRRLNLGAREDLAWWSLLSESWVGSSVHQLITLDSPRHHLFTDASGSWGCGGWCLPFWFQFSWTDSVSLPSIALKELLPIVVAAAIWGHSWSGSLVMCHSDNTAAVAQVNKLHASDQQASHLLRCLALFQAHWDFRIRAIHVPGNRNGVADDLSRNRTPSLAQFTDSASPSPTQVPPALIQFLGQSSPNWTSAQYADMLKNFCRRVSPPLPARSTRQVSTASGSSHKQ